MRFPYGIANFQAIAEEGYLYSFRSLLAAISRTPHRLYLLIDEYDNFANEVLVSRQQGESRYQEMVGGEGAIKTLFKAVKDAAEGRGLDRAFITGVSPVVLVDITSGYNVVKDISREPEYADLCGFHEAEIRTVLEQVVTGCDLPAQQADEALDLMRTFYNGYNFSMEPAGGQIYNPTLALFLRASGRAVQLSRGDEVASLLDEAQVQLAGYRKTLERIYGDRLKLSTPSLQRKVAIS